MAGELAAEGSMMRSAALTEDRPEPRISTMTKRGAEAPSSSPPNPLEAPAFVMVGPLRGGTTLLRIMVEGHSRMDASGEFEEAVSQAPETGWPDLAWFRDWMQQDRMVSMARYDHAELSKATTYEELVYGMWRQRASRHDAPILTTTIHSRFDRVVDLWPETKFVFLNRDPRAVARSCVSMGWVGDATFGAQYWLEPIKRWLRLREKLEPSRYVELRYEDLVRDPETELQRLCSLVGEDFEPGMLTVDERSTYGKLDPSLADAWRTKLSQRTIELIEWTCGELMDRFGYERTSIRASPPTMVERARLQVDDRMGKFRFRTKRYGLGLVLAWAAVRRTLPLHSKARNWVRTRLNDIDLKHLR